jgi:hypothetical protein
MITKIDVLESEIGQLIKKYERESGAIVANLKINRRSTKIEDLWVGVNVIFGSRKGFNIKDLDTSGKHLCEDAQIKRP